MKRWIFLYKLLWMVMRRGQRGIPDWAGFFTWKDWYFQLLQRLCLQINMARSALFFLKPLASVMWTGSTEGFWYLQDSSLFWTSFIYMGCSPFPLQACPLPSKKVCFYGTFLRPDTTGPSFYFPLLSLLWILLFFWHPFQNTLESGSSFYWKYNLCFCFSFFFWIVFRNRREENWIYTIMVISEVSMRYCYFYRSKDENIK